MALCVALQSDGTLTQTGEAVDACTGYVLVSGSEHSFYALVHEVFATPTPEQATAWFVGCLGAVVTWYLVARLAGSVANFFGK
jgi:hypothetical protein